MGGRSTYTQEVADEICRRLAEGEALDRICEDTPGFPAASTVRLWVMRNEGGGTFAADYARARELQAHKMAEEIIAIANTPAEGAVTTIKADGSTEERRSDMIEHRRLQVDARKWYLSKVLPKVYGDRLNLEHSGTVSIEERIKRAEQRANDARSS